MTHRRPVARIPIGRDELVISAAEGDRIDIRLWTDTSGVRFPSTRGVTIPQWAVRDLINALKATKQRAALEAPGQGDRKTKAARKLGGDRAAASPFTNRR
jgi:hypothetical protein